MKTYKKHTKQLILILTVVLFSFISKAQINVTSTGGVSTGGTTTTSTGLLVNTGHINLSSATNAFQIAGENVLSYKGDVHNIFVGFHAGLNVTGTGNSLFGCNSGVYVTSGTHNTAVGDGSLLSVVTGNDNAAFGYQSLNSTTGSYNNAFGMQALYSNSASNNCAFGTKALYTGTGESSNNAFGYYALYTSNGNYNDAFGTQALYTNGSGTKNSAMGYLSLMANTTGNYNAALGAQSLRYNTTGSGNVALGFNTGSTNTTGSNNTFIGYTANANGAAYTNCAAIGNGATTTATNMMYLGNANALLYCAAGLWTGSDGRFKTNVTENVKGLEFINKLRPVTYNLDTRAVDDFLIQNMPDSIKALHQAGMDFGSTTAVIHAGFIAQEVEQSAKETGFTSSIVHTPDNENSHYALNYAEIVVPLVKAVQELSKKTDSLSHVNRQLSEASNPAQREMLDSMIQTQNTIINSQNVKINDLQNQIAICCNKNQQNNNSTGMFNSSENESAATSATLFQNVPNPFDKQTSIQYFIPTNAQSASMMVFDLNGKLISTLPITNFGKNSIIINGNELNPGMYVYSLIVNGKIIDTKRMILTH